MRILKMLVLLALIVSCLFLSPRSTLVLFMIVLAMIVSELDELNTKIKKGFRYE